MKLPKRLVVNSIKDTIKKVNFVFDLEKKRAPGFFLSLEDVEKVDILGILIFYKFIEFSVEKSCFENPKTNYNDTSLKIRDYAKQYGFDEYITSYIKKKDLDKALKKLEIETGDGFLIAPQVLVRGNVQTKKNFDVDFMRELIKFYGVDLKQFIQAILQCAVEISSNFYNHAKKDTQSIILARGSAGYVEIACADTGDGLLETLRELEKYKNIEDKKLIKKAFDKNITSKPGTTHMGYGLWFLKEIVKRFDGYFEVYSSNINYSSKFGKERVVKSPYWKGTIVYLKISVKDGIEIADIIRNNRPDIDFIPKINFKNK